MSVVWYIVDVEMVIKKRDRINGGALVNQDDLLAVSMSLSTGKTQGTRLRVAYRSLEVRTSGYRGR